MAEVAYYFDTEGATVWTDPDKIVDNNLETFGYTSTNGAAQVLTGNNCPGTDLGIITKVELRLFGKGDGDDKIVITPIFTGGDGNPHDTVPVVAPGDWTAYVDITNDPNHPDWSLWSHIQDLDCKIAFAGVGKKNTVYCAKVEIRVTYWVPPVSDIDVGAVPIDRVGSYPGLDYTLVDKNNPANASGTLHSVKVYAANNITGLIVGTFYTTNGNTLKCRDSELVGDVPAGSEQTFDVSITVAEGDYIGCYHAAGIERDLSGFAGLWTILGEYIDPGDEATYSLSAGDAISLYGYGDIAPPPDIDIGADPIDRATNRAPNFTYIDKANPANASGTLHTIKVFAYADIAGLRVGTFYTTNGNTLKCRDSVAIGDVSAGLQTINGLSIAVEEGDYIGCYFTAGNIETDLSGYIGVWYISGEYIDPGDETEYSFLDGDAISLYGYGDIVAAPENTVYLVKATGRRTQLAAGAVAIRIDPTTGRRSLDTSLTKFLVREDDGTLRAKSA